MLSAGIFYGAVFWMISNSFAEIFFHRWNLPKYKNFSDFITEEKL